MNQTTPEPCLPECRCYCGRLVIDGKLSEHRHEIYMVHAPACPNAAPKASDAPKRCPECKHRPHGTVCFNGESDGDCGCEYGKPAPAPEAPKVEEYLRTGDGPDTLYPAKPAPAPEASEAPKYWDNTTVCFGSDCPNCERERATKPAPAPEPKQGSEVDFEAADQCAEVWKDEGGSEETLSRAYLALRAEVLDLKRKIEVLESDRGKGCNPSRDPDHNDR